MFAKKRMRIMVMGCLICLFIVVLTACKLEGQGVEKVDDIWPTEGILLAYIDGKPYYYDPAYIFKLDHAAVLEPPDTTNKKVFLINELFVMETYEGAEVPDTWVANKIKLRKLITKSWQDILDDPTANTEEMVEEAKRFMEVWKICVNQAGGEERYWQKVVPYIEKEYYVTLYVTPLAEEYIDDRKTFFTEEHDYINDYLLRDYDELLAKYNVEIVDEDLK